MLCTFLHTYKTFNIFKCYFKNLFIYLRQVLVQPRLALNLPGWAWVPVSCFFLNTRITSVCCYPQPFNSYIGFLFYFILRHILTMQQLSALEFAMQTRMAQNSEKSICLYLLNAEINGLCLHAGLYKNFLNCCGLTCVLPANLIPEYIWRKAYGSLYIKTSMFPALLAMQSVSVSSDICRK